MITPCFRRHFGGHEPVRGGFQDDTHHLSTSFSPSTCFRMIILKRIQAKFHLKKKIEKDDASLHFYSDSGITCLENASSRGGNMHFWSFFKLLNTCEVFNNYHFCKLTESLWLQDVRQKYGCTRSSVIQSQDELTASSAAGVQGVGVCECVRAEVSPFPLCTMLNPCCSRIQLFCSMSLWMHR